MKFDNKTLRRTMGDLLAFKNGAGFSLLDMDLVDTTNHTIIYIPDYNVIYPYLWDDFHKHVPANPQRSDFYNRASYYLISKSITYRHASKVQFALSDATIIEAIEQLAHKHDYWNDRRELGRDSDSHFSKLRSLLEEAKRNLDLDPAYALRILKQISQEVPNSSIKDSTTRLLNLINIKHIEFLDELYDAESTNDIIRKNEDEYVDLQDRLYRSSSYKDERGGDHHKFHVAIDAMNLVTAKHLSKEDKDKHPYFVCKSELQVRTEDRSVDEYTRSTTAPFLRYQGFATAPSDSGDVRFHAKRHLRDAYREAKRLLTEIAIAERNDIYIEHDINMVIEYFNKYGWVPLNEAKNTIESEAHVEIERVEKLLKNKRSLLEYYDEARTDAKTAGVTIVEARMPDLGKAGLRAASDITDNPHYRDQLKKLGL